MDNGENSFDSSGEMSVPYQESGPPASTFRGREEILTSLSPTPVNVFSGSSESDYLPAGNRSQKEKTHTVVPPTEVGGGSRFDFTVGTTTPSTDKAESLSSITDRLAQLETDHILMKSDHSRMQSEIDQLKNSVKTKDKEIEKKNAEISRLTHELDDAGSLCAQLEKKLASEREAHQEELKQQHQKHKQKEERLRNKIDILKRQKSVIEEEKSLLIHKIEGDKEIKETLEAIKDKLESQDVVESHDRECTGGHLTEDGAISFRFTKNSK